MKQIIGFGDNYYTLWEQAGNGSPVYIKNISKDFETAKSKYPDAEVDLSLKGVCWGSFDSVQKERFDDRFNFGKYEGIQFAICTDYNYMKWYSERISKDTQEWKNLADVMVAAGYVICDGWIMTKESYEEYMREEAIRAEFASLIENNLPFEVEFDYNNVEFYHCDWSCRFENVKKMGSGYYGYYYLPMLKGKAKRIKGKTVRMTKYEVKDKEIIIKEFVVV